MTQKSWFERSVHKCFELTIVFDIFRKVLHRNFFKEKNILRKELEMQKKTLDFGCGSGPYSSLFSKEKYVGVDVEVKNVEFARKKYQKEFKVINGTDLKNVKKVEQIFAIDVFHHLSDDIIKKYVREFARLLSKKGKVLILEHFPAKQQTNILGKLLMTFDRGKNIRLKEELSKFFTERFTIEKSYEYYAAGVRDYTLLLKKKG